MYYEINQLIANDFMNYDKRPLTRKAIDFEALRTIQTYTLLWAKDEHLLDQALTISATLDEKLYKHIKIVTDYNVGVTISEYFIELLNKLMAIDEALIYEERTNFGIGPEAQKLRKEWRKCLRECHKNLTKYHKNHLNWVKEHDKPRRTYVLNATGEIHNGLYWTIRELILNPAYIKYGFKKEVQ